MLAALATFRNRLGLLRGLIHGEQARTGPLYVTFDMTTRCNSVCRGCLYHSAESRPTSLDDHPHQELPLDMVRQLAPELARMRTREAFLAGGGEPLLHSQFSEIGACLRRAGLKVIAFTNGTLISESTARALVECGLDELRPTFWAANHQEHLAWHPGVKPEMLERRLEGLALLREAKAKAGSRTPRVNLQMPLHRGNFENLEERVRVAVESSCDKVSFGVFRDFGGPYEDECLNAEDVETLRPALLRAAERLERAGIAHNAAGYLSRALAGPDVWRDSRCFIGWIHAYFKVDGSVLACCRCRVALGNVREQPFSVIWNSAAYRDFRRLSLNPEELERMSASFECNCANCSHWPDNRRIDRVFRRLRFLHH
jgi:AdoMet-dependent heme synthase